MTNLKRLKAELKLVRVMVMKNPLKMNGTMIYELALGYFLDEVKAKRVPNVEFIGKIGKIEEQEETDIKQNEKEIENQTGMTEQSSPNEDLRAIIEKWKTKPRD